MLLTGLLRERHIWTHLHSTSLHDAIRRLARLLILSHPFSHIDYEHLVQSVCEREEAMSTCIGKGLAVPHGELPDGASLAGVMGLFHEGIPCNTPDGERLHCVVLLAIPPSQRDRHLVILAELARTVQREELRRTLYAASSPADARRILCDDELSGALENA